MKEIWQSLMEEGVDENQLESMLVAKSNIILPSMRKWWIMNKNMHGDAATINAYLNLI